jgi:hypothetical protein
MGQAVQPMADFNWQNQAPEATTDAATVGAQKGVYNPSSLNLNQYSALRALDPKTGEYADNVTRNLYGQIDYLKNYQGQTYEPIRY